VLKWVARDHHNPDERRKMLETPETPGTDVDEGTGTEEGGGEGNGGQEEGGEGGGGEESA
jgi:hypothetical protein